MRSLGYLIAFLLGAAAMVAIQGRAQETWLVFNGLAQHLSHGSHCNNHVTKGVGLEKNDWAIGVYDNSNCNWSAYAAKSWLPLTVGNVRAGFIAGAVSGYASVPLPAVGLAAAYERKDWGANLIFIPPMSESSVGVLWMQFKVRLR